MLDLQVPDIAQRCQEQRQMSAHDQSSGAVIIGRRGSVHESFLSTTQRNFRDSSGPLSYSVRLDNRVEVKRHVDHVKLQGPAQTTRMEENQ